MLKTRFLGIAALGLALGLSAAACSDEEDDIDDLDDIGDVIDDRIDDLDLDDDFVISANEWSTGFSIWDEDGNLILTTGEFQFNGAAFDAADVNNDGYVTDDEWEELLDDWDIDDDDVLEEFELDPYL